MGDAELLTDAEHRAIVMAGELASLIGTEVIADGPTRDHDLNELIAPIHVIQRSIMGQAAARKYPTQYRLLGASLKGEVTDHG